MSLLSAMVVPLILAVVACFGLARRVDVYDALLHGGEEGLKTAVRIIPALVGLLTAVSMLRASGALDLLAQALAPLLQAVGCWALRKLPFIPLPFTSAPLACERPDMPFQPRCVQI